jgi:hypothetical protein
MSAGTTATRRHPPLLRPALRRHPLGLLCAVLGLVVALLSAGGGAEAELARPEVVGRVTVAPGQTLWDVAITHAPTGTDPRVYLARLREANGLDGRSVPAWTVVLLPAP